MSQSVGAGCVGHTAAAMESVSNALEYQLRAQRSDGQKRAMD
jgi:hypothetical protein